MATSHVALAAAINVIQLMSWLRGERPEQTRTSPYNRLVPSPDELSCSTAGLTPGSSQLVQAVPDRQSHRWQRIWDVLRLIQPGAPLESNVQRDMQWDVTCCTVTFPEQFSILMAEEVHELLSPMCEETPSYLRRAGHSSSSATAAHKARKAK